MNTTYKIFCAIAVSALISCGGGHEHESGHEQEVVEETEASADCGYVFVPDSTTMTWTAYKTTEKVGVSGTFDKMVIRGTVESENVISVFENAEFEISTVSVNSANPDRDKKISDHFFGTMAKTVGLTGSVEALNEKMATVAITLNGVTVKQEMNVESDNQTYCKISADLDLTKWNAQSSIKALNDVCFDLHKGADGESKLWEEVRVELTAKVKKDCP